MRRQFQTLIIVFLALQINTGCQRDDSAPLSIEKSEPILFSPEIVEAGDQSTKGTMIAGTEYGNMPFYAASFNGTKQQFPYTPVKKFTFSTGSMASYWSTYQTVSGNDVVKEYLWNTVSGDIETKTFYAYTNLPTAAGAADMSVDAGGANQKLTYDVTKAATTDTQTDILLGYYSGQGELKSGEYGRFAAINFRHPLTAVKFKKGNIEGWLSSDKITRITIENIYAGGTCTDNGSLTWTPSSETTTTSMTDTGGITIASDSTIGDPFLIIPQNLESLSILVRLELTVKGKTYSPSCVINTGNLQAGYYYTYTLAYNPYVMGSFTVNLTAWQRLADPFTAKFD